MGHYKVDLGTGWCDCGKFQAFRVPCTHVIATCSNVLQNVFFHLSHVYNVVNRGAKQACLPRLGTPLKNPQKIGWARGRNS